MNAWDRLFKWHARITSRILELLSDHAKAQNASTDAVLYRRNCAALRAVYIEHRVQSATLPPVDSSEHPELRSRNLKPVPARA
jgi:hypothetical protein